MKWKTDHERNKIFKYNTNKETNSTVENTTSTTVSQPPQSFKITGQFDVRVMARQRQSNDDGWYLFPFIGLLYGVG